MRKFKQHVTYYNLLKFKIIFRAHCSQLNEHITTSQIVLGNLQITFHPLLGTLIPTLQFLPIVCRVQRLLWNLPYRDDCGQGIIIVLLHLTLTYTGIVFISQQTNQFTRTILKNCRQRVVGVIISIKEEPVSSSLFRSVLNTVYIIKNDS